MGSGYRSVRFANGIHRTEGPYSFTDSIQDHNRHLDRLLEPEEQRKAYRKLEEEIIKQQQMKVALEQQRGKYSDIQVPENPVDFYNDFGLLEHPLTHEPVKELAGYQIDVWWDMLHHRYVLVIKSQKIGLTTSVLLADFHFAMLPRSHPRSCRGKEILVIAQSLEKARSHLNTLRRLIMASQKYKPYLITTQDSFLLRDEVTKVTTLYIRNPDNENKPTLIRGLGANEGAVWSWKEVKHVHISDIAIAPTDYSGTVHAALTRLINTRGSMIIETPPHGPQGRIYDIYRKSTEQTDLSSPEGQFKTSRIHIREAIAAGIASAEDVSAQRAILGREFPAYFEAEFVAVSGDVFKLEQIERAVQLGKRKTQVFANPDFPNRETISSRLYPRAMGVDPGYGSSRFGIVICQLVPDPETIDRIEVIYAHETEDASPIEETRHVWQLAARYAVDKIYVDGWNSGYVRDLKRKFQETENYEKELAYAKKNDREPAKIMKVVPISFSTHGKPMLHNVQYWLHERCLAIHPTFSDLIIQMRSAQEVSGNLDKGRNSMDLVDALRLCCWHYKPSNKSETQGWMTEERVEEQ